MAENTLTINGRTLEFQPGETLLEVARRGNIFIPTLCHIRGVRPTGACRICVVEVQGGRTLSPACATPAALGMVVRTDSQRVIQARRNIIAMLLQSGHHNCSVTRKDLSEWVGFQEQVEEYDQSNALCPVYGDCKLQSLAYRYQVDTSHLVGLQTEYPMEKASSLITRDFSRCILCGRCVEACNEEQVNLAISHGFRGAKAKVVAMGDNSLERSDCVFCGQCISACPVGALVSEKDRCKIRPWEVSHTRTTCHYCGVGCQVDLHVKNNRIVKVSATEFVSPNHNRLCMKGHFAYDFLSSPKRLTTPLIRIEGTLQRASWDEALDLIAMRIKEIKKSDGSDAIAAVCSAKGTNESLYSLQKLMRASIGSNNISVPYAATGMAHIEKTGVSNTLSDLEKAPCVLLIGSDLTEDNPVAATFVKRGVRAGTTSLIVVDSRDTRISKFARLHAKPRPGTEAILINGLIALLIEQRPHLGCEDMKKRAASFTLKKVAYDTGLNEETISQMAFMLDAVENVMLVYGSAIAHWEGLCRDLQGVLGHLGKEGGGVNFIGELNNSQGACDMGATPEYLPGYAHIENETARKEFENVWECKLNPKPGLPFSEMVGVILDTSGPKIKLLYCVGENLAMAAYTMPDMGLALDAVPFLVVQDSLDSEMLAHADVVLPAAVWAEEEGTYTNCERRVQRVRQAVEPAGDARTDVHIYRDLAQRLGQVWPHESPCDIWEKEILAQVSQFSGMTYDALKDEGRQWPLPEAYQSDKGRIGAPPVIVPQWTDFNYHHRTLIAHCEGLLDVLSAADEAGLPKSAGDPVEVESNFVTFLQHENVAEKKEEIDTLLEYYCTRGGSLIPALQSVQQILGYLPVEAQNYIAMRLHLPASDVFGVVSFYAFFTMKPLGRNVVRVCLGTACYVKGADKILEELEKKLGIGVGETTEDREFSLESVRCVGACGLAPVMVVGDETYGQMTPAKVTDILRKCGNKPNKDAT